MGADRRAMVTVHFVLKLPLYSRPFKGSTVRLAVMKSLAMAPKDGGLAVDMHDVTYALVIKSAEKGATVVLQPNTSEFYGKLRLRDNSVSVPDPEPEEGYTSRILLPVGVGLMGYIELGIVNVAIKDLLWEAGHVSLNERFYNPKSANSLQWVRELAERIGIYPETRKKLLRKKILPAKEEDVKSIKLLMLKTK